MIVLDFLQQKPEHAKLRAKSNEQRDAEQKKEAETEPKVTFIQDLRNSGSRMITSKFTIMVSQTA
jgi:phage antirepressor YoqD-like protein